MFLSFANADACILNLICSPFIKPCSKATRYELERGQSLGQCFDLPPDSAPLPSPWPARQLWPMSGQFILDVYGTIPYVFDCWADPVILLLLLKSSIVKSIRFIIQSDRISYSAITRCPHLAFLRWRRQFKSPSHGETFGALTTSITRSSSGDSDLCDQQLLWR